MFWAYNLKHFFKLNIKIDAGENIHKSGKKNMLYDNKDRMIQILVYGTGVNKTFWVKIFGNYNAQHEHSQHKLLPGQKKKKKKKKRKMIKIHGKMKNLKVGRKMNKLCKFKR